MNVNDGVVHFGEGELRVERTDRFAATGRQRGAVAERKRPALVEAAMALGAQGALVAGQSPQGCYDPAASKALAAQGGLVASPAELATHLASHWPD